MKKSLNLVFLICLFLNVATVGQIAQISHLLVVENSNTSNSQFIKSPNTEVDRFDKKVKTLVTETIKTNTNIRPYLFQDLTSLLDKKSSLERTISLRETPQNVLRPIHAIDYQANEPSNLNLNITTPLQFTINRAYRSFGPVYQF